MTDVTCTRCGLPRHGGPHGCLCDEAPPARGDGVEVAETIAGVLALARRELAMDVAFLSLVGADREVLRHVDAAPALAGLAPGVSAPFEETICRRLLDGTIDGCVADVRADPDLRGLPLVRAHGIGAYLGVPVDGPDARRYVLCCLARETRPDLGPGDLRFLVGLGETVRVAIAQDRPRTHPAGD